MKMFKIVLLGLLIVVAGYIIGSFFPITGFFSSGASIIGNAELKITVLRPDGSPATNLEVDVATQPGAPLKGGIAITDSKGEAIYKVKPGNYFVFFNSINFPKSLAQPHSPIQVTLVENQTTEQTINLTPQ